VGDKTGISWTDSTWNCVRGCSPVSPGCAHCYAERVAARFSGEGQPYHGLIKTVGKRGLRQWSGDVRLIPEHLADPLRWKKPRRIFVNSMSDLFHEALTNEQIAAVFGVMAAAPQHTFQVLTKRAERMRDWFRWVAAERTPLATIPYSPNLVCAVRAQEATDRRWTVTTPDLWPLPNVWLGVSVENQKVADDRIAELLEVPAAVRFLSMEPLLEEVSIWAFLKTTLRDESLAILGSPPLPGIDWVIAGCESGPGARPADAAWFRSLRDQCAAAGVPFFLKQALPAPGSMASKPKPYAIDKGPGSKVKQGYVIELPYLDGVQHAQFPEVA
jgi:protein gp37